MPPKPSKAKRWWAQASFGPFSLGFGTGAQSSVSNKGKRSLPTSSEQKYATGALTGTSFLHNTVYTFNPMAQIALGTGVNNRIGNAVHLQKIQWQAFIGTALMVTKQTVLWRFLVVISPKQYNPAANAWGSGLGSTELFLVTTQPFTSPVDPRVAYVLCDRVIKVNPYIAGVEQIEHVVESCVINKDFEYSTPAPTYGVSSNVYFVLVPVTDGGVTGTTVVGDTVGTFTVAFTQDE